VASLREAVTISRFFRTLSCASPASHIRERLSCFVSVLKRLLRTGLVRKRAENSTSRKGEDASLSLFSLLLFMTGSQRCRSRLLVVQQRLKGADEVSTRFLFSLPSSSPFSSLHLTHSFLSLPALVPQLGMQSNDVLPSLETSLDPPLSPLALDTLSQAWLLSTFLPLVLLLWEWGTHLGVERKYVWGAWKSDKSKGRIGNGLSGWERWIVPGRRWKTGCFFLSRCVQSLLSFSVSY
jgi:hypothetical protein